MAGDANPINEAVDTVKAYAKQETIDPLKRLGPYLKLGVPGGILAGLGFFLLILGILRAMQQAGSWVTGSLSWIPYTVAVFVGALLAIVFVQLIQRSADQ